MLIFLFTTFDLSYLFEKRFILDTKSTTWTKKEQKQTRIYKIRTISRYTCRPTIYIQQRFCYILTRPYARPYIISSFGLFRLFGLKVHRYSFKKTRMSYQNLFKISGFIHGRVLSKMKQKLICHQAIFIFY